MPERRPIAANRSVLLELRRRAATATRGRDVLDQKRAVLQHELPAARAAAERARAELRPVLDDAQALLVRAAILSGADELERVAASQQARASVALRWESVMGVPVPHVDSVEIPPPPDAGPLGTSATMDVAIERFRAALRAAAVAAAAAARHRRLLEDARRTARRVAALDHVWLPLLHDQIRQVAATLEEVERDELARARWATSSGPARDLGHV